VKKFKYSLVFSFIIILLHIFQNDINSFINTSIGIKIVNYMIFGLLWPFLIIILVKTFLKKNDEKITTILFIIGVILYFFVFRAQTQLSLKLTLFEFIAIGIIYSFENTSSKSILPIILILLTAIMTEFATQRSLAISFYHYDVFLNTLLAFAGYIATTIGFRK